MRNRVLLGVGLAVVTLLVVGVIGWRHLGGDATTEVFGEAALPRCSGVEVGVAEVEGMRLPAIPMARGMRCTLTYRVWNPGDADLTVTGFRQAIGGPGGGAGFRVVAVNGTAIDHTASADGDDIDARWSGETPLAPEDFAIVEVEVAFRSSGCTARGTLTSWSSVLVEGKRDERRVTLPLAAFFRGTRDSTCGSRVTRAAR
ncbi:hypothetical protein [Nocardioides sambongensis]|uniref:hypothetical protein n=1 Tax=Nocardioides sambongensis TaxID=2589074 RepID=UPI00112B7D3A|nr:hypothetical protein [Nocardioides sambongensis]